MDIEKKDQIPEEPKEKKIQWVKIGGGSHKLPDGRVIKKDQRFFATEKDVPLAFRDVIKPLEPLPSENDEKIESITKFEIRPASIDGRGGWFNVVNIASGKPMTSKAMRQDEALKLLQELS